MTIEALDWTSVVHELDAAGCAVVRGVMSQTECRAYSAAYDDAERYRSRVVMERHGFGRGEYKYFAYPLPQPLEAMRSALHGPLAGIANRWHEAMGIEARFPEALGDFIARCHAAGQTSILRILRGQTSILKLFFN